MYKALKLRLLHNELARMHEQGVACAEDAKNETNYHVGTLSKKKHNT